ncbi:CD2 antigen cytoplasmic tail-binding protein 2-like [Durio zibethinus]|uniref:CD2 antigen cytoplasmic tail-binding protein 2-like n=1 Tax=Durio zibethinus TaxID=66656 RepID=A0A6P5XET8_DURZI|nr:CD2 antigen cytoplasmic tail-binding protein 2-like [Durio zibethinus]
MEGKPPRSHLKRQFFEDEDSNKPPAQKRVRFPKGKKVKHGEVAVNRVDVEDGSGDLKDPRLAAKERAKRRNQITTELFTEDGRGMLNDVSAAEVAYEDNENFIDDGIQIEPFNLNKEREEGYFDADGNFVEYVNDNKTKDAWLDSVEDDIKYTGKTSAKTIGEDNNEVAAQDLSTQDIGMIKRRIANVLEPGETVLQALRRLKGASNNRKEKMSAETKHVFDQLTEDAMKLMENGDYNVYHEKQEVFQCKAEGYEKLALAKGKSISANIELGGSDLNLGSDILKDINIAGVTSSVLPDSAVGTSNSNLTAAEVSSNTAEGYNMFADDEDDENLTQSSEPNSDAVIQSSSEAVNTFSKTGDVENDYVYDESSGYYYSSTFGYYYDPST